MLAAHRVPPQLMGAIPEGNGSFGDIEKAARVFAVNELTPVMEAMKHVNDWLGEEVIRFNPYALLKARSIPGIVISGGAVPTTYHHPATRRSTLSIPTPHQTQPAPFWRFHSFASSGCTRSRARQDATGEDTTPPYPLYARLLPSPAR
jgi:hypothetical protein